MSNKSVDLTELGNKLAEASVGNHRTRDFENKTGLFGTALMWVACTFIFKPIDFLRSKFKKDEGSGK